MTITADKGNSIQTAQDAEISFLNSSITTSGNVVSKGSFTLENSELTLVKDSVFQAASVEGTNSTIIFNKADKDIVAIEKASSDLQVLASGAVNDQANSTQDLYDQIKDMKIGGATLGAQAGAVADSWIVNSSGAIQTQKNAAVAANAHMSAMTLVQWRNENNHISKRLSDVRTNSGSAGAWVRTYGTDSDIKKDDLRLSVKTSAIQVGADAFINPNWIAGAAFSYTNMDGMFSNGQADANGYTLAAYVSGFFDCGGYIDLVGRIGRIATDIEASTQSSTGGILDGSYDNTAFGFSAEVGYHHALSNGLFIEPQAELSYGFVKGDSFTSAGNASRIEQDNFQSLVGRIGSRMGISFADKAGQVYLTASINHDFLGNADTAAVSTVNAGRVNRTQVDLGGTWISYGLGAQFQAGKNLQFYGSLERANGNEYQENFSYSVGMRYVF